MLNQKQCGIKRTIFIFPLYLFKKKIYAFSPQESEICTLRQIENLQNCKNVKKK